MYVNIYLKLNQNIASMFKNAYCIIYIYLWFHVITTHYFKVVESKNFKLFVFFNNEFSKLIDATFTLIILLLLEHRCC